MLNKHKLTYIIYKLTNIFKLIFIWDAEENSQEMDCREFVKIIREENTTLKYENRALKTSHETSKSPYKQIRSSGKDI